jgi:hypothetical protein
MSPNAGEWGCCGVSANDYSCTHGTQINFGDLTQYLSYGRRVLGKKGLKEGKYGFAVAGRTFFR